MKRIILSFAIIFLINPFIAMAQLPSKGKNGLWGFVDKEGNWVIQPKYCNAERFVEGLAKVSLDGSNFGFIDFNGEWKIHPQNFLSGTRNFQDGISLRWSWKTNKTTAINMNGEIIFSIKGKVSDFKNGTAIINGKHCIDRTGEVIPTPVYYTDYRRLYWVWKKKYDAIIVDINDNQLVQINGNAACNTNDFVNDMYPIMKYDGNRFNVGFIDKHGIWQIAPTYAEVTPFDKDGHAVVLTHENKLIIIDKKGNICADLEQYKIPNSISGSFYPYDSYGLSSDGIAKLQDRETSSDVYVYKDKLLEGKKLTQVAIVEKFSEPSEILPSAEQTSFTLPDDNDNRQPLVDVDAYIPSTNLQNDYTFVIIIANEEYRRVEPVRYAQNDGRIFKDYCNNTLGIPKSNIHYAENATLNDIRAEINWMMQVAEAYGGMANFIFYYAGHGIPDEKTQTSYLLPVDGYGTDVETGYKLSELYAKFNSCPANSIVVFLDACFSGSQRGESMLASARGVAIKPKPESPSGNVVVFSAATGDETAYPYEDKNHGLFTYFLLKKLQDSNGNVTLGELGDYLVENVSRTSIVRNSKSQTPTVTPSSALPDWFNMKL